MRPSAFLLAIVFLPICGIAAAKPAASKRKGEVMTQRVLYAPAPVSDAVRAAHPDFLGKTPSGAWFGVESEAALALRREDTTVRLVYPSRAEYEEEMQGLDEAQRAEALALRLKTWASRLQNEALTEIYFGEREYLARLAKASSQSGKSGEYFQQAFKDELSLIDLILNEDRFDTWPVQSQLEAVFEKLNTLNRDIERLQDQFKDNVPPIAPSLAAARKALAVSTEKAMQKYGLHKGVAATGNIFVSFERGFFIVPKSPHLAEELKEENRSVQEWKDGFVTVWEDWNLDVLNQVSKQHSILYLDMEDFNLDFARLTPAQRSRRFSERAGGIGTSEIAIHLANQELGLTLVGSRMGRLTAAKEPPVAAEISKLAEQESENLRETLAARGAWRRPEAGAGASILAAAEQGLAEARFWRDWGTVSHWNSEMQDLEKVLERKGRLVDSLRASGQG